MEKGKAIACFGEVMLRLGASGKLRLAQSLPGTLEATFGGGEANVCASLAMLGKESRYLTALPDNPVSRAFAAQLRGIGADVEHILYTSGGRMGIYFVEHGAAQRPSNVIYDRSHSVIAESGPECYDFDSMLSGCGHLHLTGITPSLSEKAYLATLRLAEKATEQGITISCDLNFRKRLWRWKEGVSPKELAASCMEKIVAYADLIIGNEEDASDVFGIHAENTAVESGRLDIQAYTGVAARLSAKFPKAKFVAITLRESISADHNNWGAMLYDCRAEKAHLAPLNAKGEYAPYEICDIVDRFGGGDSFCAGLLYALNTPEYAAPETAIRFAVAASCLKHTIKGDYNYATCAEVVSLMNGSASGRVKR